MKASVAINGCQINASAEGFRVVYSVNDPDNEVAHAGLIYGLADYATDNDLYVGSTAKSVYDYEANDSAKLKKSYGIGQSYAMTMTNIKNANFYHAQISVRAYIRLKNGTYVYGNIKKFTVYDLAHYLYQHKEMTNEVSHNYLYTKILSIADSNYQKVEFDWNKTLVTMD